MLASRVVVDDEVEIARRSIAANGPTINERNPILHRTRLSWAGPRAGECVSVHHHRFEAHNSHVLVIERDRVCPKHETHCRTLDASVKQSNTFLSVKKVSVDY